MATINGVTIKNLKTFRGHDGETLAQGSIYLNGKRLGFWSQDSWGGPDQFDFDESVLKDACKNFKDGFPKDYRYLEVCDEADVFLGDLLKKQLKSYFKKGYKNAVVVSDGIQMAFMVTTFNHDDPVVLGKYSKEVESMKADMLKDARVDVVRPSDFDITVDANHKVPAFLMSR